MRKAVRASRYLMAGLAANVTFFGWVFLLGPRLSLVEAIVGLILSLIGFWWAMHLTRNWRFRARSRDLPDLVENLL